MNSKLEPSGPGGAIAAVVAMAREFDVLTVAEGIEDAHTLRLLRDYGVDYIQGYLVGPPAPLR